MAFRKKKFQHKHDIMYSFVWGWEEHAAKVLWPLWQNSMTVEQAAVEMKAWASSAASSSMKTTTLISIKKKIGKDTGLAFPKGSVCFQEKRNLQKPRLCFINTLPPLTVAVTLLIPNEIDSMVLPLLRCLQKSPQEMKQKHLQQDMIGKLEAGQSD